MPFLPIPQTNAGIGGANSPGTYALTHFPRIVDAGFRNFPGPVQWRL